MEKERTVDRIRQFADWLVEKKVVKGVATFERICGLSKNYIKNLSATEKGNPGVDTIAAIYNKFPNVNLKWLVTGKGGMFGNKRGEDLIEQMRIELITSEVLEFTNGDKSNVNEIMKRVLHDYKYDLTAEEKIELLERII